MGHAGGTVSLGVMLVLWMLVLGSEAKYKFLTDVDPDFNKDNKIAKNRTESVFNGTASEYGNYKKGMNCITGQAPWTKDERKIIANYPKLLKDPEKYSDGCSIKKCYYNDKTLTLTCGSQSLTPLSFLLSIVTTVYVFAL